MAVRTRKPRRSVQDLINAYRSAKAGTDGELAQRACVELGYALNDAGFAIEMGPQPGYAIIWQGNGGLAFTMSRPIKLASGIPAVNYPWPKPKAAQRIGGRAPKAETVTPNPTGFFGQTQSAKPVTRPARNMRAKRGDLQPVC